MICKLYILPTEKLNVKDPIFLNAMSKERLKKIERFASVADKKLAMAAELCLCNLALELGLPIPPVYKCGETGKPEFPVSPPYFNISHCSGYALCAVADAPVGLDAEPADRTVDDRILKRLLRAGETCPSAIWKWVEKESFVKLTGEGLLRPLASFTASADGVFDANGKRLARISKHDLHGLCISIASYEQITSTVVKILSPEHLKKLLKNI
ncbi:MAG: hypothetical protein II350_06465 [Clostridia bacterium]|nr:hypothetical protein [Clostridia bacterium]